MIKDYLPTPGVVAAYVVGFLHSLAIGVEVDTGTIAEAIASSIPAVISGTGAAVSAGLIVREKVGNRYLWRRGPTQVPDAYIAEHMPKVKVHIEPDLRKTLEAKEAKDAARPPGPAPAPAPREPSLTERFANPLVIPGEFEEHPVLVIRKAMEADKEAALAVAPPQEQEEPPARRRTAAHAGPAPAPSMRAGLWSDGSLHIERGGRVETFTPSETQYLMRFLDGMLLRTRDVTVS